jgi:hypothetical protein
MKALKLLFLYVVLSCSACSTKHPLAKKKEFISAYKQIAQYSYLDEIADGKLKETLLKKRDVSLVPQVEFVGEIFYSEADRMAREKVRAITPLLPNEADDFYSRKAYFNEYLLFSKSAFLDSLAKKSYKQYKNKFKY